MRSAKKKNAELEKLMKETGIETKRELINTAITLFIWAIREVKSGRSVGSVDEKNGKWKEIVIPAFFEVKRNEAA